MLENLRSLCGGSLYGEGERYHFKKGPWESSWHYSCYFCYIRVGNDLQMLYKSPAVEFYLNSVPAKELYQDKLIYHHATLRKVCDDVYVLIVVTFK